MEIANIEKSIPVSKYDMTVYLDGCQCKTYKNKYFSDCMETAKHFKRLLGSRFDYEIVKIGSYGRKPKKIN